VAGIFSEHVDPKLKFLTQATAGVNAACSHFTGGGEGVKTAGVNRSTSPPAAAAGKKAVAPVKTDDTVVCMADQLLADDRMGDLELMLETREAAAERGHIYTNLIKLYARHRHIDRAIHLSRRLREEKLNVPGFYEILGELIESQYRGGVDNAVESQQQPLPAVLQSEQQQPPVMINPAEMAPMQFNPYYNFVPIPPQQMGFTYVTADGTTVPPSYHYVYQMPPTTTAAAGSFYPPPPGAAAAYYSPAVVETVSPPPPSYPASTPDPSVTSESPTLMSLSGESFYSQGGPDQGYLHRQLKKAVSAGDADTGLNIYLSLEKAGKVVNVTETSALIEQLVRANRTHEATEITQTMLYRNTHPLPKIFRFLLNKLAMSGAVEDIAAIGQYLSTKIKKDVSYDNRLCNAYLAAGRGAEFLDLLVRDLAAAVGHPDRLAVIQDRFPRGGAMGLLDHHPELLDKFTGLAEQFAATAGYVAPMNVLWAYHFINNNVEVADTIWERYVKDSNQIMFQKITQVARSTGNLNLAFGLVQRLSDAEQVTPGARGIAYSCLLDCLCQAKDHKQGWKVLQEAMSHGVALEDVNRTALVRLKTGLEVEGESFPFAIPPKNARRDDRSLSPTEWGDM